MAANKSGREGLIEDNLSALNNDDLGAGEGHVRDRSRPGRAGATGLLCGWIWRRGSGQTGAEVSVFDFSCWKRLSSAWLDWDFVLTRSGVPSLIGADRGRAAGSFHRDGDIGIAEARQAEASFQLRAQIGEGWSAVTFEVNARGIRDGSYQRHKSGGD